MRTNPTLDDLQALDKATRVAILVRVAEQMEALKRELAITAAAVKAARSGHTWQSLVREVHPPPCGGRFEPQHFKAPVGQRRLAGLETLHQQHWVGPIEA